MRFRIDFGYPNSNRFWVRFCTIIQFAKFVSMGMRNRGFNVLDFSISKNVSFQREKPPTANLNSEKRDIASLASSGCFKSKVGWPRLCLAATLHAHHAFEDKKHGPVVNMHELPQMCAQSWDCRKMRQEECWNPAQGGGANCAKKLAKGYLRLWRPVLDWTTILQGFWGNNDWIETYMILTEGPRGLKT